jgi:sugar/nucleoside kinase (ribokinase family)
MDTNKDILSSSIKKEIFVYNKDFIFGFIIKISHFLPLLFELLMKLSRFSSIFIFAFLFTGFINGYNIVSVGAPFLDLLLKVDEATLQKIAPEKGGSRPVDLLTFNNIIRYSNATPKVSLGGSALNVTRVLAELGQDCAFVGKVGTDEADRIFRDLARLNIDALLLPTATPTGRVCCLVTPDGQRTMRAFLGASTEELDIEDIRFSCLAHTSLVHLEGYLLYTKDGEFVKKLVKKVKEFGGKISLDCASYEVVARYKNLIMDLLREGYIDILFANEDENLVLTGKTPGSGCKELSSFCEITVVTAGRKGCWVGSGDTIIHREAIQTNVVDTTGAGDFFEAGFLHGYMSGMDIATCADYGILLGKAAVSVFGTSLSKTHWRAVKNEVLPN